MLEPAIEQFHFLRPFWLVLIPYAIWLHFHLRQKTASSRQWSSVISAHLLDQLAVSRYSEKWLRPYQLQTAALVIASLALAGPAWEREITPFTKDKAPLIIALELTPTMLATDQQPSRLERAKQKILDILEQRKGARTALISYAGSAHVVLPLTEDSDLIKIYLESLQPDLMPKGGDDAGKVLKLAEEMLQTEEVAGTLLFMTDGIDRTYAEQFAAQNKNHSNQFVFLAFGKEGDSPIDTSNSGGATFGLIDGRAPGIDLGGLNAVAASTDGRIIRATADLSDVDSVSRNIRSHLVNTLQQDDNLQWRDFGYYLLWPLAFIILLWSRRGWTVRWE